MAKQKNIVEWFDPQNKEHIKAYEYLMKKTIWPKYFLDKINEEGIELTSCFEIGLVYKIANQYVKDFLDDA